MLRTYFWKENNILFLYTFRQYSFRNKHDNEWIEEKRSKLITFTCIFFQDTRHGHHIITLLYMFPFFPISTLKSTLWVWPVSIGCSMPHRTLSYPYFFSGPCLLCYATVFNFPLDFSLWTQFVITTCPSFKN